MSLVADESVFTTEGEVQEICVVIEGVKPRERDVHISLSVISNSITSGRFVLLVES